MAVVPIINTKFGKAITLQEDLTTVTLAGCYANERQGWQAEKLDDGTYRIRDATTGRVLDVAFASMEDDAPVICWEWHGGPNQRFHIGNPEPFSSGPGVISAVHSGKALRAKGGLGVSTIPDGTPLVQTSKQNGSLERWRIWNSHIVAAHSGHALDVVAHSYAEGYPLLQYYSLPGWNTSQQWRIESVYRNGEWLVRITRNDSPWVLDVEQASTQNEARLIQYKWHGGPNQLFYMRPSAKNGYTFENMLSRKRMDVKYGSKDPNAPVQQFQANNQLNQVWLL
ncbi:RICIN domain-containing protein [Streptomyces sp. NPDC002130]|uniref:RICIN domain-containing protein n=1 Tax=Streptomyces sp. NPDC002130 TaxID=3155568 RepID=UPI00331ED459